MPVINAGNEERHRREGLTCPDAFVVAGTKPESANGTEWHQDLEASSDFVNRAGVFSQCNTHVMSVVCEKT